MCSPHPVTTAASDLKLASAAASNFSIESILGKGRPEPGQAAPGWSRGGAQRGRREHILDQLWQRGGLQGSCKPDPREASVG